MAKRAQKALDILPLGTQFDINRWRMPDAFRALWTAAGCSCRHYSPDMPVVPLPCPEHPLLDGCFTRLSRKSLTGSAMEALLAPV